MIVKDKLFEMQDKEYASFQAKLTPSVDAKKFIGVRVPILRKFAKEYIKDEEVNVFLSSLPHEYYDENMLHGLLIAQIKDYDMCINLLDKFLPYVDNWAVCDIMSPKVFIKNKNKLIIDIKRWIKSDKTYTIRFGMEMLMSHFLDDDYKEEYLKLVNIKSEEYYVNMMIAWFYATALAKKWDSTIKYIEDGPLSKWVHNKTISKACESNRISKERKEYLKGLKK